MTNDFVEDVCDILKSSRQPFVLLALHDEDEGRSIRKYNIRSGYGTRADLHMLDIILRDDVLRYMDELKEAEQ